MSRPCTPMRAGRCRPQRLTHARAASPSLLPPRDRRPHQLILERAAIVDEAHPRRLGTVTHEEYTRSPKSQSHHLTPMILLNHVNRAQLAHPDRGSSRGGSPVRRLRPSSSAAPLLCQRKDPRFSEQPPPPPCATSIHPSCPVCAFPRTFPALRLCTFRSLLSSTRDSSPSVARFWQAPRPQHVK